MDPSAAQQSWSQAPPRTDSLAQLGDDLDDFGNLFEFGDLDLDNVSGVGPAHYGTLSGTHSVTPFEDAMDGHGPANTVMQDFGNQEHVQFGASSKEDGKPTQNTYHGVTSPGGAYAADPIYQPPLLPQYSHGIAYQFHGKPGLPPQQRPPPTPNSLELHGQPGGFPHLQMDHQHPAMLEHRFHARKDDAMPFTPMASPAGTPQYNIAPEFTTPGAYFSPLTSPMLHAQNAQLQQHHAFAANSSTAPSSSATSPLDPHVDVDMADTELLAQDATHVRSRRSDRKRTAAPRVTGDPLARVKQSPIAKAVKRKSTSMLSSVASASERVSNASQPHSAGLTGFTSQPQLDSPEDGSVSPEPLSEASMGPPPRPASSSTQSPALAGRQPMASPAGSMGAAATPKSLLSMRDSQHAMHRSGHPSSRGGDGAPAFEELQLPEAVADNTASRPTLAHIQTRILSSASSDDTPNIIARKTPKLGPLSTPSSSARPSSSNASPSTASTPVASTPGALLKNGNLESRAGRGSKKRSSMGAANSTLVSPALRPRISPSIKPLLPEGCNHLPGVTYPDSLSTGLTSKRTSHKVAEQGRRNRINEALREMQALLPKPAVPTKSKDGTSASDGSPDASTAAADIDGRGDRDDANGKGNSSKAATVESANEYIRKLQRENSMLLRLKHEHEELKRRLAGWEKGTLAGIDERVEGEDDEQEQMSGSTRKRSSSRADNEDSETPETSDGS